MNCHIKLRTFIGRKIKLSKNVAKTAIHYVVFYLIFTLTLWVESFINTLCLAEDGISKVKGEKTELP